MRTEKNGIIALLIVMPLLASSASAFADSHYRPNPHARYQGMNQGAVGSCQAEAEVMALESVFAARNLPARLSTFYRHAANWVEKTDPAKLKEVSLDYTPADRALIARTGALIPDYMWPENGEGFDTTLLNDNSTRPRVSEAALIDPEFPKAESLGFNVSYIPFKPEFVIQHEPIVENITINVPGVGAISIPRVVGVREVRVPNGAASLSALKSAVAAGKAVTLDMHGHLMMGYFKWNHTTGLLEEKYTREKLNTAVGFTAEKINHALAVVGYDDGIYADQGYSIPGALIVRNSWNTQFKNSEAGYGPFPAEVERDLEIFRYKLSRSQSLPGYYALPYQYIVDLMDASMGLFRIYDLDFERYSDAYLRFKAGYETHPLPFICDRGRTLPQGGLSAGVRATVQTYGRRLTQLERKDLDPAQRVYLQNQHNQFLIQQAAPRNGSTKAAFRYALIPSNRSLGADRVEEFYRGKLSHYYCDSPIEWPVSGTETYPGFAEFQHREVTRAFELLQSNIRSKSAWSEFFRALYSLSPQ